MLKETGLHPDMIKRATKDRESPLPLKLCPWVGCEDGAGHQGQYPGAHSDRKHGKSGGTPFLNAAKWPRELTLMGYLPEGFGKVLKEIGTPHRKVKPLLKKLSRICRRHAKEKSLLHKTGMMPEKGVIDESPGVQLLCIGQKTGTEVSTAAGKVLSSYVNPLPPPSPQGAGAPRGPSPAGAPPAQGPEHPWAFTLPPPPPNSTPSPPCISSVTL